MDQQSPKKITLEMRDQAQLAVWASPKLTQAQKIFHNFFAMTYYFEGQRCCYYTQEQIARGTGLGLRAVEDSGKTLCDEIKLLGVEKRNRHCNRYSLILDHPIILDYKRAMAKGKDEYWDYKKARAEVQDHKKARTKARKAKKDKLDRTACGSKLDRKRQQVSPQMTTSWGANDDKLHRTQGGPDIVRQCLDKALDREKKSSSPLERTTPTGVITPDGDLSTKQNTNGFDLQEDKSRPAVGNLPTKEEVDAAERAEIAAPGAPEPAAIAAASIAPNPKYDAEYAEFNQLSPRPISAKSIEEAYPIYVEITGLGIDLNNAYRRYIAKYNGDRTFIKGPPSWVIDGDWKQYITEEKRKIMDKNPDEILEDIEALVEANTSRGRRPLHESPQADEICSMWIRRYKAGYPEPIDPPPEHQARIENIKRMRAGRPPLIIERQRLTSKPLIDLGLPPEDSQKEPDNEQEEILEMVKEKELLEDYRHNI